MLFATWVTALNILVFAALVAAVIYLFVLIVRALKKYIGSKAVREEKQAAKRTLGETLKAHRTRCQMTQEFEAEALGVSRQTVSKWENGSADPSTTNLLALAKLYGVAAEELLRGIDCSQESIKLFRAASPLAAAEGAGYLPAEQFEKGVANRKMHGPSSRGPGMPGPYKQPGNRNRCAQGGSGEHPTQKWRKARRR